MENGISGKESCISKSKNAGEGREGTELVLLDWRRVGWGWGSTK